MSSFIVNPTGSYDAAPVVCHPLPRGSAIWIVAFHLNLLLFSSSIYENWISRQTPAVFYFLFVDDNILILRGRNERIEQKLDFEHCLIAFPPNPFEHDL
jgi:hypothetical protein